MSQPTPDLSLGDYANVFAATPSGLQTAGGLYVAKLGTPLPADVDEPLPGIDVVATQTANWTRIGYVSSEGVTIKIDGSTKPIEVWSGEEIGALRDKFAIMYNLELFEVLSPRVNALIFGDGSVSTSAATAQHGNRMKVAITSRMPKRASFVLDSFFEDKSMRQVASNVQMSDLDDIKLVHNEPMSFKPTFSVRRGTDGAFINQYSDDGQKVSV